MLPFSTAPVNKPALLCLNPKNDQENDVLNYQLITTDAGLQQVCEQARNYAQVALDTEFVRTRTYYPQLGLIQLYDGEQLSLIDPLPIKQWQPFIDLLADAAVVKFLHAGSEDLEVFLNAFKTLPTPMVDTQILAAFSGHTLSCGFAKLVTEYMQVDLDKSESRTDWLARPLTERQCVYAAADVFYLLPMAKQLVQETEEAGWTAAADNECRLLCQRRSEALAPELAYREITNAWQLRPRQLACLQKLAEWRLRQARERDLAVNFVVREENLWAVARYMPGSLGELEALGLSGPEIRYHGKTLVALVAEANALEESALPAPLSNLVDHPGYKKVFKEIKAAITLVSEQSGLSVELLASRRQINQLLNWHWKLKESESQPELISGWRGELLAAPLQAILQDY
ncbi:Ribonuclease D [Serratia fonticola]|nr:Ribonuclease D [Serratia fonticola]CAI1157328.1 Ribonuclease D [Serratia fonticola]CAI1161710.1 Ribonuclease D [Serratia fonticola]CAI1570068.1 Ribonuclease D [Serratia fonticola]CAI1683702.1 Ribonuclease D [Serratia fonticola]